MMKDKSIPHKSDSLVQYGILYIVGLMQKSRKVSALAL